MSTAEVNLNGRWPKTLEKVLAQRQRHYMAFNINIFYRTRRGLYSVGRLKYNKADCKIMRNMIVTICNYHYLYYFI